MNVHSLPLCLAFSRWSINAAPSLHEASLMAGAEGLVLRVSEAGARVSKGMSSGFAAEATL